MSSTRLIRSFNAASILQTLYKEGSCSRTRLTELTHMSPSTVTRIVSALIEQGIITEERRGKSTGGRKPVILRLDYAKLFIVGIQLLRDRAAVAVCDLKGTIVEKKSYRPYALDSEFLIRELGGEVESLLESAGVERDHILGVGLAISGVVDSEAGVMIRSVNLGWRDVQVSKALEEILDLPVFAENDANAAALAEFWFGSAKDVADFLFLKTETGVGAGIVYGQRLMTGPRGMAGEIGHIPLVDHGRRCRCGQSGCLETYLYVPDVLKRYHLETGEKLTREQFFQRAQQGDPAAVALVTEASDALTRAIGLAGVLLDLDMVIISGIWGEFSEEFLKRIESRCQAMVERTGLNKVITVQGSMLGDDCDLLGAVGLVIDRWFTPPIYDTTAKDFFSM